MLTKFANRYNFAFLAALFLLGVLYVEGRRTENNLRAANADASRTMARVSASQNILSALQDIETGARGFVITGRQEFLDPFYAGSSRLHVARESLMRTLPDDAWYQRWLARLEPAIQTRVQAGEAVVAAVQAGRPDEGARLVKSNVGRRAMDEVRRFISEFQWHEQRALQARNAGIIDQTTRTRALRLALLVAAGVLLLTAVLAINFHMEKRRRLLIRAREGEARERRQYEFLRTIIDTDENPIFVRDGHGRFILSNRALGDLVDCTPDDLESEAGPSAESLAILQPLLANDPEAHAGAVRRQDAVQLIDAAWQPRWFQVVKRGLPNEGTAAVLTVAVDISQRMRAERLKDDFVSTVSHELRTPLTSVRGAVDLLGSMAKDLPADAVALIEIAKKNAERLLRLINDLLDLQKLEAGQLKLFPAPHALRTLLESSIHAHEGYAVPLSVSVQLQTVPDVIVDVDADRFAQIMANLLSNAIKHSPATGAVVVNAECIGHSVKISVRDHGRGIPKDFRPHVFERFTQAESNDARSKGGTGLGLAIAKSMVEQMGGSIGFETAEGLGSTFHIVLPVKERIG